MQPHIPNSLSNDGAYFHFSKREAIKEKVHVRPSVWYLRTGKRLRAWGPGRQMRAVQKNTPMMVGVFFVPRSVLR